MTIPKNVPQDPENTGSDYDIRMANLQGSDVDVADLLSGGSDIDQLIEAGVLDDGPYFTRAEIEQQHIEDKRLLDEQCAHIVPGEYDILWDF